MKVKAFTLLLVSTVMLCACSSTKAPEVTNPAPSEAFDQLWAETLFLADDPTAALNADDGSWFNLPKVPNSPAWAFSLKGQVTHIVNAGNASGVELMIPILANDVFKAPENSYACIRVWDPNALHASSTEPSTPAVAATQSTAAALYMTTCEGKVTGSPKPPVSQNVPALSYKQGLAFSKKGASDFMAPYTPDQQLPPSVTAPLMMTVASSLVLDANQPGKATPSPGTPTVPPQVLNVRLNSSFPGSKDILCLLVDPQTPERETPRVALATSPCQVLPDGRDKPANGPAI
jgi:hypothetical protein